MTFTPTQVQTETQLGLFCASPQLPSLQPELVVRQGADAQWLLLEPGREVVGRCSLWWRKAPTYPGQRLGIIGHYGASTVEAGAELLALACEQLAGRGCTMAVGPMEGNTWQRYRLVTQQGHEPPFFLEPENPAAWPEHFARGGFTTLARYFSTLKPDLGEEDNYLDHVAERAAGRGIRVRPFDLTHFEVELARLYEVAQASFQENFLYTPLAETDFLALYLPLRPYIRPELILIAERHNQPIGFLFALPDWLQAQRGQEIDTIIIKTVAIHPNYRAAGLGNLLVARCQRIAHQLGYRRAIHALMHEKNSSRKISRRYGTEVMREYGLFSRPLF
jgi:GNAT superfamily N-acetyltransferase